MKPVAILLCVSLASALAACTGEPRGPAAGTALPAAGSSPAANPAHNSRNSLDWAGTYRGVLPCADCEGIETLITLTDGGAFREHTRYLGKADGQVQTSREGPFSWNDDGNTVTLAGDPPHHYRVGENRLVRLANTGALAENYILTRATPRITGWRWTLVELQGQPVTGLTRAPFLVFDAAANRASGFSGCKQLLRCLRAG